LPVVNGRTLRPGSAQIMTRVCDRFGLPAYLLERRHDPIIGQRW
jgi:hypothetical protein